MYNNTNNNWKLPFFLVWMCLALLTNGIVNSTDDINTNSATNYEISLNDLLFSAKQSALQRIVGGQYVHKHEFPWMASLQYKGQHFCGASIIGDEWALTAAHCVDKTGPKPFEVVVGAHSLTDRDPMEQRVGARNIMVHDKWNSTALSDDIALVRLAKKLEFNAGVRMIDPPSRKAVLGRGAECMATGWGLTRAGDKEKVSDRPQKVLLPVLDQQECQRMYGRQATILGSNVCAGGGHGKGICNGDSGGPLNCMIGGKWMLAGLDSFTVPCAVKGYPSVFTRTDHYSDWIADLMASNK